MYLLFKLYVLRFVYTDDALTGHTPTYINGGHWHRQRGKGEEFRRFVIVSDLEATGVYYIKNGKSFLTRLHDNGYMSHIYQTI